MTDIDKYYNEVIKDDLPPLMQEQCKKELEKTTGFAIWKLQKAFENLKDSIIAFFIRQ